MLLLNSLIVAISVFFVEPLSLLLSFSLYRGSSTQRPILFLVSLLVSFNGLVDLNRREEHFPSSFSSFFNIFFKILNFSQNLKNMVAQHFPSIILVTLSNSPRPPLSILYEGSPMAGSKPRPNSFQNKVFSAMRSELRILAKSWLTAEINSM